jgi:ribosomal protein S18
MDCLFCQKNVKEIDFKNTDLLKKFIWEKSDLKRKQNCALSIKEEWRVLLKEPVI